MTRPAESGHITIVTDDCLGRHCCAKIGLNAAVCFKPRCGSPFRRCAGSARARCWPLEAVQSPPISRSVEWPRTCAGGTALRRNSASTAHCDGARKNTRIGAPPGRAISARPPQVHARVAVPTWRGCDRTDVRDVGSSRSTRKQRLIAYCYQVRPVVPDYAPNQLPHHSPLPRDART